MPDVPVVSVVMPVYNGERFLAEAIESILSQTHSDFEFIIVDDGSVDRTGEMLARYARRDRRVRLHRQVSNLGVTAALNQGIAMARGPFIARMDADDVSLPHRLARQLQFLQGHADIAVVGSWFLPIDEHGHRSGIHYYPTQPGLVAWSMLFYNSLAHPTVMVRREALDCAAAYRAEYRNAEDYDLFMRLSLVSRLSNIPEALLLYRDWTGNVSKRAEDGNRVLRDTAMALGIEITTAEATALQGLSRDRYPSHPADIRRSADLIMQFRDVYVRRVARDDRDVRAINNDVAVRAWVLASLAARRSPWLALTLAAAAIRTRPLSVVSFASKVAERGNEVFRRALSRSSEGRS